MLVLTVCGESDDDNDDRSLSGEFQKMEKPIWWRENKNILDKIIVSISDEILQDTVDWIHM